MVPSRIILIRDGTISLKIYDNRAILSDRIIVPNGISDNNEKGGGKLSQ